MPAFDFPNPPTPDQEVTNDATGVTYRYDAATQSWVIVSSQSAANIASDVAQLQSDVNTLEALLPLETSARQQGDANLQSQIDDIDVDDIDLSDYYTKTEVDGIIDGIGPAVDPDNYYTKVEADNTTTALQIQIDDLKITKGAAAVYTLNDIGIVVGIRPGDFYIDNTVAKNVQFMTFAPTDNNGNDRPLGSEGDIVELVGLNNKHYRYEITTAGEGVAGVSFITAEDPDDLLIPGTTFQVYIYPQNSASASTEYVDAGLATKLSLTGGELSGNLTMNGGTINTNALIKSTRTSGYAFQVHDAESDANVAFIHSNGNIRGAQGVFTDSVEIRGITTLKNSLNLEADVHSTGHFFTKAGSFRIDKADGTKQFQIYPNGSDYGATVYSYNNGYFKVRIAEGDTQSPYKEFINCQTGDHVVGGITHPVSTQINWLKTPTSNHHAANKQYVDDMGEIYYGNIVPSGSDVNDGDLWVDSGNMRLLMRASGAWVNPDREADTSDFKQNATPNGRKFGFYNGTGAVTGKLNYFEGGDGVIKLRLSNTDAFGIKWNDGGINQDVTMTNGPYFTIWEVVDETNHKIIRQGRISRIDYHDSDILCYTSSHRTNGGFSTSKQYWVTIGGII